MCGENEGGLSHLGFQEVRIKMTGKVYLPTKSWDASKKTLVGKIAMLNPKKPVIIYNWSKLKTKLPK